MSMENGILEKGSSIGSNGAGGSPAQRAHVAEGGVLRVWHVDDSANFRDLLASFLDAERGVQCERSFPSAEAVLHALARETPPDVILLDIRMGGMSGLDALRPIRSLAPSTAVLLLTTFYDSYAKAQALRDGASDLLLKTCRVGEIVERAREAHRALLPAQTARFHERGQLLDPAEVEVMSHQAGSTGSGPGEMAQSSIWRRLKHPPVHGMDRFRRWLGWFANAISGLVRRAARPRGRQSTAVSS